jgi:hypothetical protein
MLPYNAKETDDDGVLAKLLDKYMPRIPQEDLFLTLHQEGVSLLQITKRWPRSNLLSRQER